MNAVNLAGRYGDALRLSRSTRTCAGGSRCGCRAWAWPAASNALRGYLRVARRERLKLRVRVPARVACA